jgi:hypothetical protein
MSTAAANSVMPAGIPSAGVCSKQADRVNQRATTSDSSVSSARPGAIKRTESALGIADLHCGKGADVLWNTQDGFEFLLEQHVPSDQTGRQAATARGQKQILDCRVHACSDVSTRALDEIATSCDGSADKKIAKCMGNRPRVGDPAIEQLRHIGADYDQRRHLFEMFGKISGCVQRPLPLLLRHCRRRITLRSCIKPLSPPPQRRDSRYSGPIIDNKSRSCLSPRTDQLPKAASQRLRAAGPGVRALVDPYRAKSFQECSLTVG